jgi:4-amino-4-deoxy-L-arabinose transferase-like glycosyltransferase
MRDLIVMATPSVSMTTRLWVAIFVLGLILRVAVLSQTSALGTINMDERQYSQIAGNIIDGNGFALGPGTPTSIRPPAYPGLVAVIWTAFGTGNLQAIRAVQVILSAATAALVYLLGAAIWGTRTARLAAAICWLYPSLVLFDYLIVTETLFTCLLVAFLLATVKLVQEPRPLYALACGVSLGLAALTRSVFWPLPLILCPALMLMLDGSWSRRASLTATVLVAYVALVGPWTVRNTRLQHVVIMVDTLGDINLRMGNYEYTPDDRMWDAIALEGEKNWAYGIRDDLGNGPITEGQRAKWAQRKAVEYMRTHPGITLRRSFIKFADFWGLEREFFAGMQREQYSPPLWFEVLASAAILVGYALVSVLGAAGIWTAAPDDKRVHAILLLPIVVLTGAHTITLGHPRYHLPVMPIFGLYAAALAVERVPARALLRRPAFIGAAASIAILLAIWTRQIIVSDLDRILSLLHRAS